MKDDNNNNNNDITSVHSSALDESELYIKRKNERFATWMGILAQLVWGLNNIHVKTFSLFFPKSYNAYSCILLRFTPLTIAAYIICKVKNHQITPHKEIKNLNWFLIRNISLVICVFFWVKALEYLRASTVQVLQLTCPIFTMILSSFILKESFYVRYICGITLCFIGSAIIVLNDNKPQAKKTVVSGNTTLGILSMTLNVIFMGLSNVGQKIVTKNKMDIDEQTFFLGLYNVVAGFVLCCVFKSFDLNLKYIIYVMANSILFYLGNYLMTVSLKYMGVSKFQPLTYLNMVFTYIFGFLLLGEVVFFTDLIGVLIVVGFQVYNLYYPVGKQISKEKLEKLNENKKNEQN